MTTRSHFLRAAAAVLPAAIALSATCGLAYALAQQLLRTGANDPQVQLAEDAARALDTGADPMAVVGPGSAVAGLAGEGTVDVATSLAPFMVVYDASGNVLATDAQLDGRDPMPPAGVLATARAAGSDRVTWQPRPGVRIATVTIGWSGGSVLAGRSLREVEAREDLALQLAALAWLAGLAVMVVAAAPVWLVGRRDQATHA